MNDLRLFTDQHSKSVGRVFKAMGVQSPVTPQNVLLQTLLHPDFIDKVADQIEIDHYGQTSYTNFGTLLSPSDIPTGSMGETKVLDPVVIHAAATKKSKAKDTLSNILNVIAGGIGSYIGAKKAASGSNSNSGQNQGGRSNQDNKSFPPPATPAKHINYFLIGGIAAIIVLVLILSNKKKA